MKLRLILSHGLLLLFLFGGSLVVGNLPISDEVSVGIETLARVPLKVIEQPKAILAGTQQLPLVVEQFGQFSSHQPSNAQDLTAKTGTNHLLEQKAHLYLSTDANRISIFSTTDIISPFHHFF